jgi:energy-coupling factor transport system substrate-specific component
VVTEDGSGLGLGDGLLIGTIGFALAVSLVGLAPVDAPWLTFLLSSSFILYFLTAIIMLVLAGVFISFEEGRATAYEVAIIAMLSATSIALRVAFAALPQVQPSTFIILATGVVYGSRAGFMVGALTPLVSNFFLGHGLWTPFQMFAWGAAGATAGLVAMVWPDLSRNGLVVMGIVWGFLYGWITNLSQLFFVPPTWQSVITIYALSFWFEVVHAAANAVIAWVFAVEVLWVLRRYRTRFEVEYVDPTSSPAASS